VIVADQPLSGTSTFITGGGSGIGRSTAVLFASLGSEVTVAGRGVDKLEETVDLASKAGGRASAIGCEVTDEESVRRAVEYATGRVGRLDFSVNSAGISHGGVRTPAAEHDLGFFDELVATNVRGMFLSMKYELGVMHAQGSGAIVNVSSGTGLVGVPGAAGYTASKHAQIGLTKSAALDYAPEGIRVNAVCPGLVDTPMIDPGRTPEGMAAWVDAHPMGRIAQPEEIADAIHWLATHASFVTGVALPVDGGLVAR
jgi:NAD(P)-dependent dehydrogenase (short-subunit alcohol dehydrogenase family)